MSDQAGKRENGNFEFSHIDYLELYVGNAFQSAYFYQRVLGFDIVAYKDLTMGSKDQVSYLLRQGNIRLLLTSGIDPSSPVFNHVNRHSDSVKDIAFNTVHSLVERKSGSKGFYLPGYQPYSHRGDKTTGIGVKEIDHMAICVNPDQMREWCDFYKNTLGFYTSHAEDVYTENSGMKSEVVRLESENFKFVIIEPAASKNKSQIEEFLNFNQGEGVQHFAFLTDDIIETVKTLKEHGIQFLNIPDAYYEDLLPRVAPIEENLWDLQEFGILADRDEQGYLLQVFSKPLQSRPTLFIEVIQREGATGFGSGNIKALFKALEKEQQRRGNL
ncbi:MAG: 4-hydroxyphenylpyruvate dioxygenase [bacterium]|nr:4-hydroxyphenylpyruvate dioxygenase [bacterium]